MLNAQAQLSQHIIRQITWRLGDEIHAHAFRANQSHHLFQTLLQCLGRAGEQQVRFVEKQRQQRFLGIAALRQLLEQFGQQPQQERRIDLRCFMHQTAGIEQVNAPATIHGRLQHVFQLQRRFAEQRFSALLFQRRQTAQQRLAGTGGHQRSVIPQ